MVTFSAGRTSIRGTGYTANICEPQRWVETLLGKDAHTERLSSGDVRVTLRVGPEFSLVSATAYGVRRVRSAEFQSRVEVLYDMVFRAIGHRRVVRFWNFIPGILEPVDDFDQRYKAFNIGRFNSFVRRYGGRGEFGRQIATASGIGTEGDDLTVHALATGNPATPVENPRQTPSYRYSSAYGPLPPCFARAIRVQGESDRLLVAGTASIRGENTIHANSLDEQLDETLLNLAAVVAAGLGMSSVDCDFERDHRHFLERYRDLRAYCPNLRDVGRVSDRLEFAFPAIDGLELFRADLCRPGLLVEIEGWATMGRLEIR